MSECDQRWRESAERRLNGDEVLQIWRLCCCENFACEWKELVLDAFSYETMKQILPIVVRTKARSTDHGVKQSFAGSDDVSSTKFIAVAVLSMKRRKKQLQLTQPCHQHTNNEYATAVLWHTGQPAVPSVPLTLLAGRQEEHPACKNWMKTCWCGYRPAARCRLLAYGPADTIAITKPHHLLPYWCSSSSSKQDYQHPQLRTGAFCWSKGLWFLWITWRLWHMCGMTNKQGMQVSCLAAYVMPCTGEPGRKVRYKSLNCTDHILDASPDAQQTKVTIMQ